MHTFRIYKAADPKKPTGSATLVATETCGHGENLHRIIRELGAAQGLGKYRIFDEDLGHIHLFQHGWIKRTSTP